MAMIHGRQAAVERRHMDDADGDHDAEHRAHRKPSSVEESVTQA